MPDNPAQPGAFNRLLAPFFRLPDSSKGAILIIMATILFACMILFIKLLGERLSVVQIVFVRQMLMGLIMLPVIATHLGETLKSKALHLQSMRIALGLISILIGFTAVIELPLAQSTTIGFARSFFVTLLAIYFLHEYVGPRRWAAVLVGFIGVVVVMRPGTDAFSIYSIFALVAAGSVGGITILNRKLAPIDGAQTTVTFLIIGVGVTMAPFAIANWIWPTWQEWVLFIGLGSVTWAAQMLNVEGFKYGEASFLASLDYIRLIFAVAFGYLFFGDVPDSWFYLGATIIIAAAVYTLYREYVREQKIAANPNPKTYNPN